MDEYAERLIQGHFDDALTEAERQDFVALVRDSEAARQRFWEIAEIHGLAQDAARIAWPGAPTHSPAATESPADSHKPQRLRSAYRALRRLGPVAAGLLVGTIVTSLAWALAQPLAAPTQLVLFDDFEATLPPLPTGAPSQTDRWSGDFTEIAAGQSGVAPADGANMLRFLRADYDGKPNPGGYISEVYRLVDIRGLRSELADGEAVAQLSAMFNAAPSPGENYNASIALFALDAATATDGALTSGAELFDRALAVTRRSNQTLDRSATTWQTMWTDLRLPPGADYLLVRLAVAHSEPNRRGPGHEVFAAHFVDQVRVIVTRRPAVP